VEPSKPACMKKDSDKTKKESRRVEPSKPAYMKKDSDRIKKESRFNKQQILRSPSDSSKSSLESDSDQILETFKKIHLSEEKFSSPPAKQISLNKNIVPETPLTPVIFTDKEKMANLPPNTCKFHSYFVTFNLRY
jgi:hypothetical protein